MITPLLNETKRVTDVFFEVMRGKEEGVVGDRRGNQLVVVLPKSRIRTVDDTVVCRSSLISL